MIVKLLDAMGLVDGHGGLDGGVRDHAGEN